MKGGPLSKLLSAVIGRNPTGPSPGAGRAPLARQLAGGEAFHMGQNAAQAAHALDR